MNIHFHEIHIAWCAKSGTAAAKAAEKNAVEKNACYDAAKMAAAAAKSIPLQRAATPGRSGTDTDAIFTRAGGIPSGLLSLPIRYMHTTVELANIRDLRQISEVFAAMILGLGADEIMTSSL